MAVCGPDTSVDVEGAEFALFGVMELIVFDVDVCMLERGKEQV